MESKTPSLAKRVFTLFALAFIVFGGVGYIGAVAVFIGPGMNPILVTLLTVENILCFSFLALLFYLLINWDQRYPRTVDVPQQPITIPFSE